MINYMVHGVNWIGEMEIRIEPKKLLSIPSQTLSLTEVGSYPYMDVSTNYRVHYIVISSRAENAMQK